MINLIALAAGVAVFLLGLSLRPGASFSDARRRALMGLSIVAGLYGTGWIVATSRLLPAAGLSHVGGFLDSSGSEFLIVVPFVICLVGIVAIALSDSISHTVRTLRRILYLLALAMMFVGSTEPVLLGLCWALSPVIVWMELRSRVESRGASRLFAIFHIPSVILFIGAIAVREFGGSSLVFAAAALAAIGIRESVIPAHTWFVRFVEEAPMGLVVAFVAPQLGVYAHIELLMHNVPSELAQTVAVFGALTALIAAILGVAQTSARRGLAYLMISQTGLVAFGIEGTSSVAFAGSLVAWQVLAVATTGFAMTLSALEARRGELSLKEFSGCFSRTPRMAGGFLMMGLGSVGFPLTLGFVAEDLLVQGSVQEFPLLSLVLIVATALNGMNVMRSFFHLFSGVRVHTGEADLTNRESWSLSTVLVILLLGGLIPGAITSREFPEAEAGTEVGFEAEFEDGAAVREVEEVEVEGAEASSIYKVGAGQLPTLNVLGGLDHPRS